MTKSNCDGHVDEWCNECEWACQPDARTCHECANNEDCELEWVWECCYCCRPSGFEEKTS